jgi:hypothetical protein
LEARISYMHSLSGQEVGGFMRYLGKHWNATTAKLGLENVNLIGWEAVGSNLIRIIFVVCKYCEILINGEDNMWNLLVYWSMLEVLNYKWFEDFSSRYL